MDDTSVLVKYTYYGDTDLTGLVGLADFNRLAANFGMPGTFVWFQGDLNFNGSVTLPDFNLLAANFGREPTLNPLFDPDDTYGYTVRELRHHLLHGGHGLPPR